MNEAMELFFNFMTGVMAGLLVVFVLVYAYIGFSYSNNDARTFDSIIEICQTVGYIQNERFKIDCEVKLRERNILNQ